ncbi:uncharacterized, partial [Tachysurus ichikawai]
MQPIVRENWRRNHSGDRNLGNMWLCLIVHSVGWRGKSRRKWVKWSAGEEGGQNKGREIKRVR